MQDCRPNMRERRDTLESINFSPGKVDIESRDQAIVDNRQRMVD